MRRFENLLRFRLTLIATVFALFLPSLSVRSLSAQSEAKRPGTQGTTSPPGSSATKGKKGGEAKGEAAGDVARDEATGGGGLPGGASPDRRGFRPGEFLDAKGNPVSAEAFRNMTPAQRARLSRSRGTDLPRVKGPNPGAHLFKPTAYLRPRRLAPGEEGELRVIVTLTRDNVVQPDSDARLVLDPANLQFIFGNPVLAPASTGTTTGRYKGRLIYDDTLDFRVPVTVRADANAGSYPVRGHVQLVLHASETGMLRGTFVADIQGTIKIGAPLPRAAVPSGSQTPRSRVADPKPRKSPAKPKTTPVPKAREATNEPTGSARLVGAQDDPEADDGSDFEAEAGLDSEPEDESLLLWGIGGGVGLVVILLLLFRRR